MVLVGFYFSRKNKNSDQFTKASGSIPGWAIGLSIYATFLSSNTFLGVPGKAFGSNWNAFVFSISMPLAAWIASKYFVPFYRNTGEISAYTHLENRFGPWARTYTVICFLLTQLGPNGFYFFWYCFKPASAYRFRYGNHNDSDGNMYYSLHCVGWNGSRYMD
jgi:SSS family solute:Na+ symporter